MMLVHYYGIQNCRLEERDGEPVLIAPSSASTVLLTERGFRQTPQGEWVYTLTAEEAERTRFHEANAPDEPLIFGENPVPASEDTDENAAAESAGKKCVIAARIFAIAGMIAAIHIMMLAVFCFIAAFVCVIFGRVRYPESKACKRALRATLIGFVAAVILLFLMLCSCQLLCRDCEYRCNNMNCNIPG